MTLKFLPELILIKKSSPYKFHNFFEHRNSRYKLNKFAFT